MADLVINTTGDKEACPNNLAPTTSTTAQLIMGDAIAVALLQMRNFTGQDFSKFHPGGALGKKLYLKCEEIARRNQKPSIKQLNISNGQEIKNLNKNILIQGEVSEESTIEINDKKVFKITGNKFEYLLGVEEGNVEIKIKVVDKAGNEYIEKLNVTYKRD